MCELVGVVVADGDAGSQDVVRRPWRDPVAGELAGEQGESGVAALAAVVQADRQSVDVLRSEAAHMPGSRGGAGCVPVPPPRSRAHATP
ncbi:hypothetical protein [Saccharopolyspora sp. ASAGF58]|uniref:hypothetical protein n=1 Tax=Saccharopolyspora sp. ASAGF58 TaxID=2719023 RepID=UPI00143FE5E7|nr:hypothetical protein [Saccharopolyspora sp. ASAGF58]QIZ36138.1 hypothetical protein FDZ84_17460 [Saccharopolyspora sp. ASAGF58]